MTSEPAPPFVWVWLPGATQPVVAGRLDDVDGQLHFTYARSYIDRSDAIPLQPFGLPLERGVTHRPADGLTAHGIIRDAAPDSWGQRVILYRRLGRGVRDTGELELLTYLLEAGSDRIGALDVLRDHRTHTPRESHGTLEQLVEAGERLALGQPLSEELDDGLAHGTSVGGARPKALLVDGHRSLIAKFSVSTDVFPWMQAEAVGMELARRCGIDTATTTLTQAAGRDVLLVERFDRPPDGTRRNVCSGLTLLGLDEFTGARYASYADLAELIRQHFGQPTATLHELYGRIAVNILVGNTDDHARNHAAFFDGRCLALTPAFDVCPQPRSTGETAQAMAYGPDGERRARLADLRAVASVYRLDQASADAILDRCVTVVREQFDDVCQTVGVQERTRDLLWERSVCNPSIFYREE